MDVLHSGKDITRDPVDTIPTDFANGSIPLSLPMMHAYMPMMAASALTTAGRLGLFEMLADGPMTPSELALALHASLEGIKRLTDFLVAAGHLQRTDNRVLNTPETMRWFTSRGDVDYTSGLAWTAHAWRIMEDLPNAVLRGGPEQLLWDRMLATPELGTCFSEYMRAFAEHLAPDLLASVEINGGTTRLLDLGGSHGTHSVAFCNAYPDMEAVIVDQASALAQTDANIKAANLSNKIAVHASDIRDCNWGDGFDVALYLSVAHNMTLEENRRILRHLATVMRPGGHLIIHDYPRTTTPALFEAAFRLTLLVETGTRTLTYVEFEDLLTEAGFTQIWLETLDPAEKGALIVARR